MPRFVRVPKLLAESNNVFGLSIASDNHTLLLLVNDTIKLPECNEKLRDAKNIIRLNGFMDNIRLLWDKNQFFGAERDILKSKLKEKMSAVPDKILK